MGGGTIYSQSSNEPRHKTYSGEFSLDKMAGGYVNNKDWRDGTATYQYKDAADGTRIFDGSFKFTKASVSANGNFQNNAQEGQWEWNYGSGVKTEIRFMLRQPHGKFKVYNPNNTNVYFEGSISGGLLEKDFLYTNGCETIRGKFYKGKPVGVWTYNSCRQRPSDAEYDNNGNLIKRWGYDIFDETTGDKKRKTYDPENDSPEKLRSIILHIIQCHLLRNTNL